MLKDFDFDLPQSLIAQHPLDRGKSRLLHRAADGKLDDMEFWQICDLLQSGDVLVLNNTRVIPSCLQGYIGNIKLKINLINRVNDCDGEQWEFLSQPRKKIKLGSVVQFSHQLVGIVIEKFNQNALDVMEFFICPTIKNTLLNCELSEVTIELIKECILYNCDARVEMDETSYIPVGDNTEVALLKFLQDADVPIHLLI